MEEASEDENKPIFDISNNADSENAESRSNAENELNFKIMAKELEIAFGEQLIRSTTELQEQFEVEKEIFGSRLDDAVTKIEKKLDDMKEELLQYIDDRIDSQADQVNRIENKINSARKLDIPPTTSILRQTSSQLQDTNQLPSSPKDELTLPDLSIRGTNNGIHSDLSSRRNSYSPRTKCVKGMTDTTFLSNNQNITTFFFRKFKSFGKKVAIIDAMNRKSITFEVLAELTQKVIRGLLASNFSKGDHLLIYAGNSTKYLVMVFAVWYLSGIIVPIPMSDQLPTENYLNTAIRKRIQGNENLWFCCDSTENWSFEMIDLDLKVISFAKSISPHLFLDKWLQEDIQTDACDFLLHEKLECEPKVAAKYLIEERSEKIICLTQFDILLSLNRILGYQPTFFPNFVEGLTLSVLPCLLSGNSYVSSSNDDSYIFLQQIDEYKINTLITTSLALTKLSSNVGRNKHGFQCAGLSTIISVGPSIPTFLRSANALVLWKKNISLYRGFCSPYFGGLCTLSSNLTQPFDPKKLKSIGSPLSNLSCHVKSILSEKTLDLYEVGELELYSAKVGEKTENYTRTQDICYIDSNGQLHHIGRSTEIIRGGDESIYYCLKLEEILISHPLVDDISVLPEYLPNYDANHSNEPIAYISFKATGMKYLQDATKSLSKYIFIKHKDKKIKKIIVIECIPRDEYGYCCRDIIHQVPVLSSISRVQYISDSVHTSFVHPIQPEYLP